MKELKYYVFKFRLKKDEEFCSQCNLIDTHVLMLGNSLSYKENEMKYALDKFLSKFDGHDVTNFCIIPKTIFNESCIYEHIGGKVYLISPVFLTDRDLKSYRYPELVGKIYDDDLKDIKYISTSTKEPEAVMEIVKDLFGEDVING